MTKPKNVVLEDWEFDEWDHDEAAIRFLIWYSDNTVAEGDDYYQIEILVPQLFDSDEEAEKWMKQQNPTVSLTGSGEINITGKDGKVLYTGDSVYNYDCLRASGPRDNIDTGKLEYFIHGKKVTKREYEKFESPARKKKIPTKKFNKKKARGKK